MDMCVLKDRLISIVEGQLNGDLSYVDAKELGEVMDMAKDCAEIDKLCAEKAYYCAVTKAMHETDEADKYMNKYLPEYYDKKYYMGGKRMPLDYDRDYMRNMDIDNGRMYYTDPRHINGNRDGREGNSPMYRRTYMEMKDSNADATVKRQELENYLHELSNDVSDMMNGMDANERQIVKQKLTALANKI